MTCENTGWWQPILSSCERKDPDISFFFTIRNSSAISVTFGRFRHQEIDSDWMGAIMWRGISKLADPIA